MRSFRQFVLNEGYDDVLLEKKHMHHPMDVPAVKSGNDLIQFFYKFRDKLHSGEPHDINMTTKLDGNNCSFRLNEDGIFCADRGTSGKSESTKWDIIGATIPNLVNRFPANPGLASTYEKLFNIFEHPDVKKQLYDDLVALELINTKWENPSGAYGRCIDAEWLERPEGAGAQNVIGYDFDFIALHKLNFFEKEASGSRSEHTIPLTESQSKHLDNIATIVNPYAESMYKMQVHHKFADIRPHRDESGNLMPIDLEGVLATQFAAFVSPDRESPSISLFSYVNTIRDVKQLQTTNLTPSREVPAGEYGGENIIHANKPIGAVSKKNYLLVLNKMIPLDSVYAGDTYEQTEHNVELAIQGAMVWHTLRELGHEILSKMEEAKLGDFVAFHPDPSDPSTEIRIAKHEGITIYDSELTGDNEPVKITGEFIVQGVGGRYAKLAQL
jgi:hypothetical protein